MWNALCSKCLEQFVVKKQTQQMNVRNCNLNQMQTLTINET